MKLEFSRQILEKSACLRGWNGYEKLKTHTHTGH